MATLQDSIGNALAKLPADGVLVPFAGFREEVLNSGDENARDALAAIVERPLAVKKLVRDDSTGKLVLHIGKGG